MGTAIGILLFVIVYGPIAYVIYRDMRGRRPAPAAEVTRMPWRPADRGSETEPDELQAA